MKDNDKEGFEDLTDPNTDGAQVDPNTDGAQVDPPADSDSDSEDSVEPTNSDDAAEDVNTPDPAMDAAALEATIAILQTENALQAEEIERWKNINLQLLLSIPNDATVGTGDEEDIDGDDPPPYSSVSGSDSLFEIKGE